MRRALVLTVILAGSPAAGRPRVPAVSVGGWLATDLVVFHRTEPDFGDSWNAGPSLRAARVTARAALAGGWRVRADAELASGDPWLQEAWIEHDLGPGWLRAGRLRVPFGRAQQASLPDLHFPEMPILAGNANDANDVGVVLGGALGPVDLRLGVVSGSRDVLLDGNELPDVALRVVGHVGRVVEIGASATWGEGPQRHGLRGRLPCDWTFADPPTIRGATARASADVAVGGERFGVVEGQASRSERERLDSTHTGDLAPYQVWGVYLEGWALVAGAPGGRGLEVSLRAETADVGDGGGPLDDTWVEAGTVGLGVHLGHGARLGLAWQIARLGHAAESPDGRNPVQSFFVRLQLDVEP